MSGFEIDGTAITLALYALTQVGGGLWLLSTLKAKANETDRKLDKLEAKIDRDMIGLRSEFHDDLSALRTEMTRLAVEVGKTIGRQDAKG